MIFSYDLLFLVFVYTGSIAVVLILTILGTFMLAEFILEKHIKYAPIKISAFLVLFFLLYLSLPWWFLSAGMNIKNTKIAEACYKFAISTSVFPSVKSYMCSQLGNFYFITNQGKKAITNIEKANSYEKPELCYADNLNRKTQCKDYVFTNLLDLCTLYTAKGDTEKGVQICSSAGLASIAAKNYIITGEYNKALGIIEKCIEQKKGSSVHAHIYAMRGHIYEKLGKTSEAEKNYKQALNTAKNSDTVNAIISNKNYYSDLQKADKLKYGF